MFQPIRLLFLTASFFCGLGFSFMFPLIGFFLVEEIGVSPLKMGVFLAIQVSSGVGVATFIGKKSDRGWSRKWILVISQMGFCLALASFIVFRNYYALLATSVLLLSIGSATLPQMFTMGRLYAEHELGDGGSLFMSLLRAAIAVAWVMGPPLAFMMQEQLGFAYAFASAITSALVMIGIVFFLPEYRSENSSEDEHHISQNRWYRNPSIILFLISSLLMFSAATMYNTTIALYLTKELFVSSQWAGYLMGTAAFLEIPFMVLAGLYGPKLGNKRLMLLALLAGIVFYFGLLVFSEVLVLMALQFFNGIFMAIISTLGLILIQDLMKRELGVATTLFTSSQQLSMLVASLLVGVIAQFLSYYAVFIASLVLVSLAFVLLIFVKESKSHIEHPVLSETILP